MASIGKFTTQLLQASQETTVALANMNFDFSLVRVEAPPEYQKVGEILSARKKANAEEGRMHVLVRKLGALFRPLLPECSNLLAAYGERASEIAKESSSDPEKERRKHGIFFDHAGIDGSSIWAAATSGHAAITVHLLACMLARMWQPAEAVSIWVELVENRKSYLKEDLERGVSSEGSPNHLSDAIASKLEISRQDLADLDSSARSWLRTGDAIKKTSETQLRLLIDNVEQTMSPHKTVFESVINVWRDALRQINGLLGGMSFNASGPVLLALSAWHLYPDIFVPVLSQLVKLNDPLMDKAGIITIGMPSGGKQGLFWSLPLAHLRFYGRPVQVSGGMGMAEGNRLTVDEFIQVFLFEYLLPWGPVLRMKELLFFETFTSRILAELGEEARDSWLDVLRHGVRQHLDSTGVMAEAYEKLAALGARRGCNFTKSRQLLFGILDTDALVHSAKSPKDQIHFLRQVASEMELPATSAVIRFRNGESFEFTSAVPLARAGGKPTHVRWEPEMPSASITSHDSTSTGLFSLLGSVERGSHGFPTEEPKFKLNEQPVHKERTDGFDDRASLTWTSDRQEHTFLFIAGDPSTASLWARPSAQTDRPVPFLSISKALPHISTDSFDFPKLARQLKLKLAKLTKDLKNSNSNDGIELDTLRAFSSLVKLCRDIPEMTIDVHVVTKRLRETAWGKSLLGKNWRLGRAFPDPVPMSRAVSFSSIAMMESADVNINPQQLKAVMGISSENSLFVSSALLQDPSEEVGDVKIRRIHGNIGRAGMGLMISPSAPMVKEAALESWNVISHADFKGDLTDSFSKSSLHLSFTEYILAMDSGVVGGRDTPAYFIETVISLYDQAEWIADLDVLKALVVDSRTQSEQNTGEAINASVAERNLHRVRCQCVVPPTEPLGGVQGQISAAGISCIDKWEELLEPPMGLGIVRGFGNWQARLAATTLSVTRKHDTVVVANGGSWCWKCTEEILGRLERDQMDKPPIIIM